MTTSIPQTVHSGLWKSGHDIFSAFHALIFSTRKNHLSMIKYRIDKLDRKVAITPSLLPNTHESLNIGIHNAALFAALCVSC